MKQISFIIICDKYGMVRMVRRTTNHKYDRTLETLCLALRVGDKVYGIRNVEAEFDTLAFMKRPSDMGIEKGCLCRLNENSSRATGVNHPDPMGFGVLDFVAEMKSTGYYVRGKLGRVQDHKGRPDYIAMPGDEYEIEGDGVYQESTTMVKDESGRDKHRTGEVNENKRQNRAQGRNIIEVRHGNLNLKRTPSCNLEALAPRIEALRRAGKTDEEIADIVGCEW